MIEVNPGSVGTEILDTELWVYNRILTDSVLDGLGLQRRVYEGVAPMSADFPFIVYQWQGGHDYGVFGSTRLISTNSYVIKTISQSADIKVVKPFTDRIDALFSCPEDEKDYTMPDGIKWHVVFNSHRTEPFSMMEQDGGRTWHHRGGVYEIITQSFRLTGYGRGPYGSGPYGGTQ